MELKLNQEGPGIIVEVGGTDTMSNRIQVTELEDDITVIRIVTGVTPPENIMSALLKICAFRCIHVGSRALIEEMRAAMEAKEIQPVIDKRAFTLPELREALEYLEVQKHIGKVAIRIP
ncbi:hypothetical protein J3F84DRAFT_408787 [Trichoderma pleuroticola]